MTRRTITHTTRYTYDAPVSYALQKARLRPQDGPGQSVLDWTLEVEGGRIETSYRDHYGNLVDLISTDPGATEVAITAKGACDVLDMSGITGAVYGRAPLWHFAQPTALTTPDEAITALSRDLTTDTLAALHETAAAILKAVPYETGHTDPGTTAAQAMAGGAGVCQDHAHIFIAAARAGGLPARYVSGYLYMPDREDQDASHAWAEVHVNDIGWVGFDVSNGISPDDKYIRIATGRDAADATPLSGMRQGGADAQMVVTLQVQQ